jgi:hypothetical protein
MTTDVDVTKLVNSYGAQQALVGMACGVNQLAAAKELATKAEATRADLLNLIKDLVKERDYAQMAADAEADEVDRLNGLKRQPTSRLTRAAPEMFALLVELVDLEGPLPGNSQWGCKALNLIAKIQGEPT